MYILIDIGGTNTRVALAKDKATFGEPVIFPTPQHFDLWLAELTTHITTLSKGVQIHMIIAGMAGTFTDNHSCIHTSPHLPEWNGIPIKQRLEENFSCQAIIENDTALVGLGEAVFGAGKGNDIAVYITLSTGVGGVRIVNNTIDKNAYGFEIGHQIVNNGNELEYYLAGSSHEKRFGIPSKDITDSVFWEEVHYYTAVLAANTTMYWSPHVIIFGGPVTNDINLDEVANVSKKFLTMYETTPKLLKSTLGALGGLYGGLAYLKTLNQQQQ